jgi:hypothetical protein
LPAGTGLNPGCPISLGLRGVLRLRLRITVISGGQPRVKALLEQIFMI